VGKTRNYCLKHWEPNDLRHKLRDNKARGIRQANTGYWLKELTWRVREARYGGVIVENVVETFIEVSS